VELPRRKPADLYLPDGAFTAALQRLRSRPEAHDLRICIANAFDFRTRMLPYWFADKRMAPCSVRTLADVLNAAGFKHVRVVLQQWTPNFKPSQAVLDGRPVDLLLVSAMQVHAEPSYELVRDAHRLGAARPLIITGGPKAIYEPTDYFDLGPEPGVGADCVATGEAYVLLDLLETILAQREAGQSLRTAFERARRTGALDAVPGVVYLSPDSTPDKPIAVSTGVQRLLRDLDELPIPDAGYRLLEPPHRGQTLCPQPYPAEQIGRKSIVASIICTQGCKFACPYCPIPAVNQRTWRHKSPERFVAEIRHIYENFGIKEFFGTDDNFFNKRETVATLMDALANATTSDGTLLSRCIRFYTEGTQFDVYKNRDLLSLCHRAGMRAIWFGIEDITGELVSKGQNAQQAAELFTLVRNCRIEPMVMMIHSDDQPLRSPPRTLTGLINQAKYLFDIGAVSYQCTYLGPAVGTKDFERAAKNRILYKNVGGLPVPNAFQDGNHVVASKHPRPWDQELNLLRAYISFYNPLNLLRVLVRRWRDPFLGKQIVFQLIGHIGLAMSIPKMLDWARKLRRGPIEVWDGLQQARIPMVDAATGKEMNWAIEYLPSLETAACPSRSPALRTADHPSPHPAAPVPVTV
jgi:radical SAM superfamily enzyme YgiQ (UPF0313 family)